ncbi:DJ-1/PfpI family protein [Kurthia zopfii]|uniref:DJ-1/PfpI family protein n=1 Tax=Kurthia zopfii TaxID=1650 RepID=UPI000F6C5AB4|nr:DJ-1/PfpI family protein [Kurthia zopfii]VEI08778.1 Uncharacterized protease ydeA [Kurthia zopfii]
MKTIYIYVLNTLADWELGHITAELNSKRFFKAEAQEITIKTVSYSNQPIKTMGGFAITPDCLVEEIDLNEESVLLLPGADTWSKPEHIHIVNVAKDLLAIGGTVAAICGATVALGNAGLLNTYSHTSNGLEFLEMFCPIYEGQNLYIEQPSACDHNLITASSTGVLMWTKQIIESLDVFEKESLEAWFNYFNTGNAHYFFELMQTLPANNRD